MVKKTTAEGKCPKCGSTNIIKHGVNRTQEALWQMGKCKDCAAYFYLYKIVTPAKPKEKEPKQKIQFTHTGPK